MGEYHYRQARFTVERVGRWRYYVADIKLPWQEGTMLALGLEAGWFGFSPRVVIWWVKRSIDKEFCLREWNGEPTHRGADSEGLFEPLPYPPLPDREVVA